MLESVIAALKDTPIPTILVIVGIVFLLLAIAGQLAGRIAVAPERQRSAAVIGGILLTAGVVLYVIPQVRQTSPRTQAVPASGPSMPSTPESSGSAVAEDKEPNDHITAAKLITEGIPIRGAIATDENRDFFKFTASSTKTRVICPQALAPRLFRDR